LTLSDEVAADNCCYFARWNFADQALAPQSQNGIMIRAQPATDIVAGRRAVARSG
jgi:hypothetical protein